MVGQLSPIRFYLLMYTGLIGMFVGCAGYQGTMKRTRSALAQGRLELALEEVNNQLGVSDADELPSSHTDARALYLVERATILQAMSEYRLAARDMMIADNLLEYMDVSSADALELGKYLYSESATTYRAPAYERLLLNSLNMVNFLAIGNFQAAKVEARRFSLIETFFAEGEDHVIMPELRALGNYLGGVAFERSGDYIQAARYYAHAYYFGYRSTSFRNRLVDLVRLTDYKPGELRAKDPNALQEITKQAEKGDPLSRSEYRKTHLPEGDTLILVQTGMVPYRNSDRVSIGRALEIASYSSYAGYQLSVGQRRQFRNLAMTVGISFIFFPVLNRASEGVSKPGHVRLRTSSGEELDPFPHVSVDQQMRKSWEQRRGALMVAAITRFITRLIVSGASMKGVEKATGSRGLGFLSGILSYIALQSLDRPDTRSWMTLPAEIRLVRTDLKPAPETVTVQIGSRTYQKNIEFRDKTFHVLNISRHR